MDEAVADRIDVALEVEVARGGELFRQTCARGRPTSKLKREVRNRRGTLDLEAALDGAQRTEPLR